MILSQVGQLPVDEDETPSPSPSPVPVPVPVEVPVEEDESDGRLGKSILNVIEGIGITSLAPVPAGVNRHSTNALFV